MPSANDTVQVKKVFEENSQWKNPCSVEVWQWKNYAFTRSIASQKTNYILFQSEKGDQVTNEQFGRIVSHLSRNQTDFENSSRICIVKHHRNKIRKFLDEGCSFVNLTKKTVDSNWKKDKVSLHVEGVTSDPFAYFDAKNGVLSTYH